jgi:hypothetical protein
VNLNCHDAYKEKPTFVRAKIYDDRAELVINDSVKTTLQKTEESARYKDAWIDFKGKLPNSERTVQFQIQANPEKQVANQFSLGFSEYSSAFCDVEVPYKIKVKKFSAVEKCIWEISDLIYCAGSCDNGPEFSGLGFRKNGKYIHIASEQAIKLSPNWDYKNPKFYQNNEDGILNDYEKDACETLVRVQKFIDEYGYDFTDCEMIASDWGENRDKLYRCPKMPWLSEIQQKVKDSKFLSVFKLGGKGEANIKELQKDKSFIYMDDLRHTEAYGYDKKACWRVLGDTDEKTGYYAVEICDGVQVE